jgi:hypothetical protein
LFQNTDKDGVIGTRKVPSPTDVWRIPEVEKVVLRCTRLGLPVGIAGMKFHRLGAKLVRSGKFCDFHTCDWRKVPTQQKQDIWDAFMVGACLEKSFFFFFFINFTL